MKISLNELQDFDGTLKELRQIIDITIDAYGENTPIYFDAGYNNVDVIIVLEEEL